MPCAFTSREHVRRNISRVKQEEMSRRPRTELEPGSDLGSDKDGTSIYKRAGREKKEDVERFEREVGKNFGEGISMLLLALQLSPLGYFAFQRQ